MFARPTFQGWIIRHRCSWIMVYVFIVMPRVNLIVTLVTYVRYLYSINCPTAICLPSMLLFILWRDTTSELWTPVQFPLYCYYRLLYLLIYIPAYYYFLPLDTLNSLFTANRWDWQPHHKLGAKFLVVLCAGSTLLLVQSKVLDEAPYKLSGVVTKLAGITFWSLAFSYWFDKLWFHNRGKTCYCAHHTFLLGSPTGVIYTPSSNFSGAVAGEKEDFCKGCLSRSIVYFVSILLYFIFTCIVLSKIQKKIVPL
jgi:hypothetical protein